MITLCDLKKQLKAQNLSLSYLPFGVLPSISSAGGAIALNQALRGRTEEKEIIAHEMGHFQKGLFYHWSSDKINRARYEYRADTEAIEMLIPKTALEQAVQLGATEVWSLAEEFGVSEGFVRKALYYHGKLENCGRNRRLLPSINDE